MNKDPMFEPPPRPWKVAYGAIYNADESIRIALADRDNSLMPTQRDAVIAHAVKCVNEYERLLELANLSDEHLGVKEVEGEELCLFHRLQSQFSGLLQAYLKARERIEKLSEALTKIACYGEGPIVTSSFDEPGSAQIAREALEEGLKRTWNVMGPDEIPISPEPFATEEEAKEAAKQFVERFRAQGYYSGVGYRIPLDELPSYLQVYSEPLYEK